MEDRKPRNHRSISVGESNVSMNVFVSEFGEIRSNVTCDKIFSQRFGDKEKDRRLVYWVEINVLDGRDRSLFRLEVGTNLPQLNLTHVGWKNVCFQGRDFLNVV